MSWQAARTKTAVNAANRMATSFWGALVTVLLHCTGRAGAPWIGASTRLAFVHHDCSAVAHAQLAGQRNYIETVPQCFQFRNHRRRITRFDLQNTLGLTIGSSL